MSANLPRSCCEGDGPSSEIFVLKIRLHTSKGVHGCHGLEPLKAATKAATTTTTTTATATATAAAGTAVQVVASKCLHIEFQILGH